MQKKVFMFKGAVEAHGMKKEIKVISIANNIEEAYNGACTVAKEMCSELCEHATYKFTKRKEMNVEAIIETSVKKSAVINRVIVDPDKENLINNVKHN